MSKHQQKKLTKSKKWIDYSSEQQNEHKQQEKPNKQNNKPNTKKQSKQDNNKPVLSTSHQPVKEHLLEDKKELLNQLKLIKGNTVWVVFSPLDQKNANYLNDHIQSLKKSNNKQILNIYPSRDLKNAYDLRVQYDLCQKWILQGCDPKNLIKIQLRKKTQPKQTKYQPKYEQKNRDYRPVKQYNPQHTTSTRYQPKSTQYKQKQTYKEKESYRQKQQTRTHYRQQNNKNYRQYEKKFNQPQKKKYIQKNPLAEQIEQKVEQELKQRKQNKGKEKKTPTGSKFYSKNPFDQFNDSD